MRFVDLGDIAEYQNGYAFKPTDWSTRGLPIIRIQNLNDPSKEYNYYNGEEVDEKYFVEDQDILIAWSASLGVYIWDRGDAWLNQHTFKVNFTSSEIDRSYFVYAIKEVLKTIESKLHGSTMKHITKTKFLKLKIPLPSLEEQKAIVAKLDRAQRLIDIDKEMLAKYDQLIQSMFLEMFGDPVTNPKGWDRKPMKQIGELKSGGTPSRKNKEYFTGDLDWYTTGELESMYLGEAEEKITEAAIEESSAKLFEKGSLLIGMYDTSAFKLGILTGSGSSNQASANIKLDDEICVVEWLYFCLKIMRPSILHERRGIRQKNLTLGFLKKLEIIMPPLEKQIQFSQYQSNISNEKKATEVIAKKSEELFSSLVQEVFG